MEALVAVLDSVDLLGPVRKEMLVLRTIASLVSPHTRSAKVTLRELENRAGYSKTFISRILRTHTNNGLRLYIAGKGRRPNIVLLPALEEIINYMAAHMLEHEHPERLAAEISRYVARHMKGQTR